MTEHRTEETESNVPLSLLAIVIIAVLWGSQCLAAAPVPHTVTCDDGRTYHAAYSWTLPHGGYNVTTLDGRQVKIVHTHCEGIEE